MSVQPLDGVHLTASRDERFLNVDLTPLHLFVHHGHMMTNQLGFLPREDALLGQYAHLYGNDGD